MTSSRVASFRRRNCQPSAPGSALHVTTASASGSSSDAMRYYGLETTVGQASAKDTNAIARNRKSMVDIRSILSLDDFEAFCVQASSGGSLYGMLRRQALSATTGTADGGGGPTPSKPAPANRLVLRQRSKSLIQRSVALSEEKSIIKLLCDYTETNKAKHRLMRDNRRHSEAALLCGIVPEDIHGARRQQSPLRQKQPLLTASQYLMPPKFAPMMSKCSSVEGSTLAIGNKERDISPPSAAAAEYSSSNHLLAPSQEHHRSSLVPPSSGVPTSLMMRRSVCRRRSFSLSRNGGLVNDGDEMVVLPTSPTTLPTEVVDFGQLSEDAFDRRVSTMSVAAAPPAVPRSRTCSIMSPNAARDVPYGGLTSQTDDIMGPATDGAGSAKEVPVYRVLMLGGPGVGKTALTQQFVTSEYIAAQNTSFDDGIAIPIPVQLEGEASVIEFVDLPYNGDMNIWRDHEADGYIIVYSITDRRSYQKAVDLLFAICGDTANTKPVILAANKSDLERSRVIGKQEGKSIAETYNSKYIDVSAILNHHVDELLVGVLKQLRLREASRSPLPAGKSSSNRRRKGHSFRLSRKSRDTASATSSPSATKPFLVTPGGPELAAASSSSGSIIDVNCFKSASSFSRSRGSFLRRIVRRSLRRRHSKSCENLLRL